MKSISFNPISIIAIIIVVVTLIYSYFKYRLDNKQKQETEEQKRQFSKQKDRFDVIPVITAAVAMLMEHRPFKIKNIVVGKKEEISGWRIFGRQEIMRRRCDMHR
jgi:heme/copper-type cytochrome/quinol oxidase subunit 2